MPKLFDIDVVLSPTEKAIPAQLLTRLKKPFLFCLVSPYENPLSSNLHFLFMFHDLYRTFVLLRLQLMVECAEIKTLIEVSCIDFFFN